MRYNPATIEAKWQRLWEQDRTYAVSTQGTRPKFYVLDMFPYPSGHGLHVGHLKGYVASDIVARFKTMGGFDVLHPMGWDSFGLPAERQAVKDGIHPAAVTARNINTFRGQLQKVGLGYDWDREMATSDVDYYRWTQWIFLKLYHQGLAYMAEVPVNWCPALNTVLANEEVQDGVYKETGDPVERRSMKQWMLKITAYADRLLEDLALVDWPESIKEQQRNWIGRSEGARVRFAVADTDEHFEVFTTRPDTLFGCTYATLAPEHPLVERIVSDAQRAAVAAYQAEVKKLSERDRIAQAEIKTGVFTGAYAVCPVNGERVPIWIADYVLMGYGTGAVFACPAHDERDHGFATRFGLPIVEVVKGGNVDEAAYIEDGPHVNSEFLDGLDIAGAKKRIVAWLEEHDHGRFEVQYRLRDWLFSRQRYWGEPFPIVHARDGEAVPLPEDRLPVALPHLEEFQALPDGRPPLARDEDWGSTTDPRTGEPAWRETNTMPQWAGSCWYYLRFIDPKNSEAYVDSGAEKRWMPVDLYVGGTEHAVLHLLYARFWHKVLFDLGLVSTPEPFMKLVNQGMITARSFRSGKKYFYPGDVEERKGDYYTRDGVGPLETQIEKMSKSRYNVTTPDEVIQNFGADTLRLYETFIGPVDEDAAWQTENIPGVRRFLDRTWRLLFQDDGDEPRFTDEDVASTDPELDALLHKTVKAVTDQIDRLTRQGVYNEFKLNTAVSALMIFVNEASRRDTLPKSVLETLVKLLAPFAPHLAEEMWQNLGYTSSVTREAWPTYDEARTLYDQLEVPVQVNGKLRGLIQLSRGTSRDDAEAAARADPKVTPHLMDKNVVKVIVVPDKMVNFVVR
jgi:leucyl-tRNA synthetase